MEPLKILVVAYACRPHYGSEPGVGWNLVRELVNYHQVWLLTRANNQPAIAAELATQPLANLQVFYADLPQPFHWLQGADWGVHLRYYLWQLWAYRAAKTLQQDVVFDLAHHVTYGRYCDPSFLAFLPAPFVWGPLGGGESAPYRFWSSFSWQGQLYEICRNLSRWCGESSPFVRLTAQRCATAIAATTETAARLTAMGVKQLQMVPGQTGINQAELEHLQQLAAHQFESVSQPVRFLSLGRLLHWKGFHLGLRAFAAAALENSDLENSEYWIVGDGPNRPHLESLVRELGIEGQVHWLGNLPREQALSRLATCDVLVHPSLHDFSPTVCLEAMAAGRPVICLDLGGPAGQITADTGIRIPAHEPEQTVRELAAAMLKLASNFDLRQQMGKAGQERVKELYSWKRKGEYFAQLYYQVCKSEFSTENQFIKQ